MTPWIIDANQMDAEDIVSFEHNLLHPNIEIRDFLDKDNKSKTIVIAPKGYGKTLLLKAKCKSMHEHVINIIPSNGNLVDKPSGSPYVIKSSEYDNLRQHIDYWHNIWVSAFAFAIIKNFNDEHPEVSDVSKEIFLQKDLSSPCDIFARLTSLNLNQYYKIREDYLKSLLPRIRNIKISTAVFVDNLDEYYENTLQEMARQKASIAGNQLKSYWYLSQIGIASASREINGINSHLKIFVSIRKEVLQKATTHTAFGTQLRGKSLIIDYSHKDLEAIIEKNIRAERPSHLRSEGLRKTNPIEAFFGPVLRVVHPATGEEERIVDFWLRHTLGRPRDVVAIGAQLSNIPPNERTAQRLRTVVRNEARELALNYMTEMKPHLEDFAPELLYKRIHKNVLTAKEMTSISKTYAKQYQEAYGVGSTHSHRVFDSLFKIGLLGYVTYDAESSQRIQIFRSPGEEALDGGDTLPKSNLYLIHPALDEVIFEINPDYFKGLDKCNIIGHGRRWRDKRINSYILKGDVVGSSRFMQNPELQKRFEELIKNAVAEHGKLLKYAKTDNGDSIKLVDANPIQLIIAALNLQRDLKESELDIQIRFGGDAGLITTELNAEHNGGKDGVFGQAVLMAARLEPLVKPGQIYVTKRFYEICKRDYDVSRLEFIQCGPEHMSDIGSGPPECIDGQFNLSKPREFDSLFHTEVFWITAANGYV